ncbi:MULTISPECIES: PLP-dependent aminotransferase family protein [unclassified Methylophilus]|uniref:aminotransferase-like domain-containing protein n=1 Tax=unclassified Methylophilus TaxID=2630143 RepID=UPI0006F9025E|nr:MULTISPECIES: PLP-dependent aminotransferase family protein [unclassified Methylophilus]KQT42471.1 GntR family transcriptional regulator [Methylophilus sp. Leaf416]KQT56654.1 GntR family transcriptional regulator [Methylophilus sp. Leaf459]
MKLYEELANSIAQSIYEGVLSRGDKLPSVRQTCKSRNVSSSTVFRAYYLLEARGLISAHERSGYFVTAGNTTGSPSAPDPSFSVNPECKHVDVSELVFEVLESIRARNVVPLGSAFPSPLLFPCNKLAQAMASSVKTMDRWHSVDNLSPGDLNLRRQIALRYMIDGLHIQTDEIVVTNGALEALNLCLMAVTRPGDTVLIESPTFYGALQSIERIGLKAIEIPSHPRDGIDLEAMEKALQLHKPKACWLMTNFQNPSGSLLSDEKKKALVELLCRYQVPLIEDDVYGELYFGNKRPAPAKAFDTEGLGMHCSSFSKCLAPGYRIGWVATGQFSKAIERLKLTTTLSASVPAQVALAKYLQKGGYDKHLRSLRHSLLLNQINFIKAIERYFPAGTRLTPPQGGYFLWVKLPDGVNALAVHRIALTNGISIAPGPIFSAQKKFTDYIRLNYGHIWDASIEVSLATLGNIIRDLTPSH